MLRSTSTAILLLALAATPVGARADTCAPLTADHPSGALARTDHQASGNRAVDGCGPLAGDVVDIALGGRPTWVLPDPAHRGTSWFVVLDDGSVDHVIAKEGLTPLVTQAQNPPLEPGEPPLALAMDDGQVIVGGALRAADGFDDPLPGTRVTEAQSGVVVTLTDPTDRYAHGVLGDELEASAVTLRDAEGGTRRIEVSPPDVIEGLSPLVADLDADDLPEIIVTVSNTDVGARLVAFGLDGELVAESEPIGRGFRWLHQVGVGSVGPQGETEVIVVRTPHIGGVVEAYRLVDDRLRLVATQPGYSSHQLGSSNLDMALLADADGDGRLDVVVPTQDMTALGVLVRGADGFDEIDALPLGGSLASNVAATPDADGSLVLAAGTTDGRLRIFR